MPSYPAFALLLGSAMAMETKWIRVGTRILGTIAACAAIVLVSLLVLVRNVPAPGDISNALIFHPRVNSLSMGHIEDLTLHAFAYLRLPMAMAAAALVVGTLGAFLLKGQKAYLAIALMMVLFFQAARSALVVFDPYLSSRTLAESLQHSPEGTLIVNRHYYPFSSVFFYTNRSALLLNGRALNLEYGASAPGAPDVFIDDMGFRERWLGTQRYYLVASEGLLPHLQELVGEGRLNVVKESGGKVLLTNSPLPDETAH